MTLNCISWWGFSSEGESHDAVANVLDCDIVVNKFELWSFHYVYFWTNTLGKGINLLIPLAMG